MSCFGSCARQFIEPVCENNANCERVVVTQETIAKQEMEGNRFQQLKGNDAMITKTGYVRNAKGCKMKD